MTHPLSRRIAAEFLGSAFLAAAVIGSGIMGERLAGGNVAIALLANTVATGAALAALIVAFGPISGAHFNPAVSVAEAFHGRIAWSVAALFGTAQLSGGILGVICANVMFALPAISISHRARSGAPQWFSEAIATFGLILVIHLCARFSQGWLALAVAVASYIAAAYWFTASTSFANPALTIARSFSNSFAGIRPSDVPAFLALQFTGGFSAAIVSEWLGESPGRAERILP
jgi:glycerol uptake facilitator-like aquaporin